MIILKRKAPILLILLISITFVAPSISYGIVLSNVDKFSKSSILIDQDTGRVLYEKNPDLTFDDIISTLKLNADVMNIETYKQGCGKINLSKLLN